jgi:hypothetical protein
MKTFLTKPAFILCLVTSLALSANAQYTETFESQTPNVTYFTSNSQDFTLTNSFIIFSSRAGYGYQHSNRFVDNSENVATNQANSIKTTNGAKFTVDNLWLYVSSDGGSNPSDDGSVIITGKLAGVVQFTINKTSGFSSSFVPNNGYSYVDFTTEGGIDNSNINIDEIEFQLQGNFNYIGIDNFTWAPALTLPLTLLSYSASIQPGGSVKLSWQTAYENNTKQFIIEKSNDGQTFKQTGIVAASGNSNVTANYEFFDQAPFEGVNYYRLDEVDIDGFVKQLGIRAVTFNNRFTSAVLYPNPVIDQSFTLSTSLPANAENSYILTDISGRIIQRGRITSPQQQVNVSQLAAGNYTIKLSDGEVIKWIKN